MKERGEASWYGEPYHGRRAASGEVYDMEQFTAAHRTLPFQTWVQVTNLDNGKQVDVRITDRGPFVDGRILDLSRAAAREIDLLRSGVAKIELRVIAAPTETPTNVTFVKAAPTALPSTVSGGFAVQAGAFSERERAEVLAASLLKLGETRVIATTNGPTLWRVWVGKNLSSESADHLAVDVKVISGQAFVVREAE
ncbi:MAG: septal ring lytic transglycosylase RlpA family protein [Acidobacteriota bacterium]